MSFKKNIRSVQGSRNFVKLNCFRYGKKEKGDGKGKEEGVEN